MAKKKKQKIKFEDLGGYVLDDDGNRREIGTIYPEKFTYKGHANVYRVYRSGDSLAATACEGEISSCFVMSKGVDNLTDEDLDRKWQDMIITETMPPFTTHYTLRAQRRLIRELYELGLQQMLKQSRNEPPSADEQGEV